MTDQSVVDFYDVERMIRDAVRELRVDIARDIRDACVQLRAEYEAADNEIIKAVLDLSPR